MKKKFVTCILMGMLLAINSYSQVSVDPNDNFYKDAKVWETKGIVKRLPQMRPYSIATIKKILSEVKESESEDDIRKADFYEKKYFSKGWNIGVTVRNDLKASTDSTKDMFSVLPQVYGDLEVFKLIGFGYKAGALVQNSSTEEKEILPSFNNSNYDTYEDPMFIGKIVANMDMAANFTIGTDSMYGMFGINKIAFGPFLDDSVLLNGTQFHSGNFSFIYEGDKFGYSQSLTALSRGENNGTSGNLDFVPEKFMGFHNIRFSPVKQFSVSYFEACVFSNRFDPCYFLPVPYLLLQGMYAATDNLLTGLTFDIRPFDTLSISIAGAVDDMNLTALTKGQFDKTLKIALQAGVSYTPPVSFIDMLSLNYTLVTPFTYSHCDPRTNIDDLTFAVNNAAMHNKDNFTTRLSSLGTKLPPNSDRIYFEATFTPIERLRIDFSTSFARHANIAESFNDEEAQKYLDANNALSTSGKKGYYATDGSVWTTGLTEPSRDYNRFLQQDHIMYVLQCAVNAEYELERMKFGSLVFSFGYMFEYIYNKGVDENIYSSGVSVSDAKKVWVAKLHNVFNNYFSASVKYYY